MKVGASPLLGFNTNVRHKGQVYHIQTEDSGVKHPHVITHLFADGGRIVASRKTTYAQFVGTIEYPESVKLMMRDQHKAMVIALRDCEFDDTVAAMEPGPAAPKPTRAEVEDLERAAAQLAGPDGSDKERGKGEGSGPGRYQSTRPAHAVTRVKHSSRPPASIFGNDLLSEKSLDEVILAYLAEDIEAGDKP